MACRLARTKACHLLLLFVSYVLHVQMAGWHTHSQHFKKCNAVGRERVSQTQEIKCNKRKKWEKRRNGYFEVNPQQTVVVPYPDPCWALPTTAWTCPDGTLPSQSWLGYQTCSGQPCGLPRGWWVVGGAMSAVCRGQRAHPLHLVKSLGVKTVADCHILTQKQRKTATLCHPKTKVSHKATLEKHTSCISEQRNSHTYTLKSVLELG